MSDTRQRRIENALCRGSDLVIDNPRYCRAVHELSDYLFQADLGRET